ncbi:alpha/beta-type small acid-soluble spore protein [Paenibacillus agaridevorans]|jgi:small acid-soluble spore protein D (minor alpha/beta-type SASP)|nr:alpha/beta-type small acid-soluble spore protein [Paenibacillus agaridevorans]
MARRRKYAVPGAEQGMAAFKAEVMKREGYQVDPNRPDNVKFEVAKELGVPLKPNGNGNLTTEEAGHIGGRIGGSMVKELIRLAQDQLAKGDPH